MPPTSSGPTTSADDSSGSTTGEEDEGSSSSTGFLPTSGGVSTDTGMVDTSDTTPMTTGLPPAGCDCPPGAEFCSDFEDFDADDAFSPFEGWQTTPMSGPIGQSDGLCNAHSASTFVVAGKGTLGSQISRQQAYDVNERGGFMFGGWLRFSGSCLVDPLRLADVVAGDGLNLVHYRIELMLRNDLLVAQYSPNGGGASQSAASMPAPAANAWIRFAIGLSPQSENGPAAMVLQLDDVSSTVPIQLPISGSGQSLSTLVGTYSTTDEATCQAEYDAVFLSEFQP